MGMAAATSQDEFDPTQQAMSPTLQVFTHIMQKGFQAGSVVGSCAVVPATVAYRALYRKAGVDQLQLLRRAGVSSAVGVVLISLLGIARLSQIDQEGMVDRAYRLHYNDSQNRTDAFATAGAAAGLAAVGLLLRGAPAAGTLHYLGASAAGTAAGVVLHVLTRPQEHKSPDKMMHELRSTS